MLAIAVLILPYQAKEHYLVAAFKAVSNISIGVFDVGLSAKGFVALGPVVTGTVPELSTFASDR